MEISRRTFLVGGALVAAAGMVPDCGGAVYPCIPISFP
ncbi:MAG: twin-arginine translocation signal domain-containing protein [Kiritimatiellae bacterium]|nr:twin-arginine translocation signal domain-containing protein [Kiritimatiellia bacterium]